MNREELHNFINKQVRFVGKVVSIEGEITILEAPDGGTVRCKTVSPPPSTYVEVIAQVMPDLSLTQTDFMFDLGDSLNMDLVNESIKISFHPKLKQHWEPASNVA